MINDVVTAYVNGATARATPRTGTSTSCGRRSGRCTRCSSTGRTLADDDGRRGPDRASSCSRPLLDRRARAPTPSARRRSTAWSARAPCASWSAGCCCRCWTASGASTSTRWTTSRRASACGRWPSATRWSSTSARASTCSTACSRPQGGVGRLPVQPAGRGGRAGAGAGRRVRRAADRHAPAAGLRRRSAGPARSAAARARQPGAGRAAGQGPGPPRAAAAVLQRPERGRRGQRPRGQGRRRRSGTRRERRAAARGSPSRTASARVAELLSGTGRALRARPRSAVHSTRNTSAPQPFPQLEASRDRPRPGVDLRQCRTPPARRPTAGCACSLISRLRSARPSRVPSSGSGRTPVGVQCGRAVPPAVARRSPPAPGRAGVRIADPQRRRQLLRRRWRRRRILHQPQPAPREPRWPWRAGFRFVAGQYSQRRSAPRSWSRAMAEPLLPPSSRFPHAGQSGGPGRSRTRRSLMG